MFCH
jgi:hypothetical protein